MYTQCPECGTVFKVTPDVLRMARGDVRCGVCDSIFNAVHYLSDQPAPVRVPRATPAQSPSSAPVPTPAGLSALQAQVAAFQSTQPDPASAIFTDPESEFDPTKADWTTVMVHGPAQPMLQNVRKNLGTTASPESFEPAVSLDSTVDAQDDGFDLLDTQDSADNAHWLEAAAARPGAKAYEELFRSTAAAAAGLQQKSLAGRERSDLLEESTDTPHGDEFSYALGELADPQAASTVVEPIPPNPDEFNGLQAQHPSSTILPVHAEADTNDHHPPVEPTPSLSVSAPVEPLVVAMPTESANPGWGLGVLLLLLLLTAQAGHYWRQTLASVPGLGSYVQQLYESIGRPLDPGWQLSAYDVRQLGVSSDVPGTLRLLARIQNKANRPQPYPLLRVTLLDRFETKIARREFAPAEYLPSRRAPQGLLPHEQAIDADLLLADPGNDAVSFELDVCLQNRDRLICAQDVRNDP